MPKFSAAIFDFSTQRISFLYGAYFTRYTLDMGRFQLRIAFALLVCLSAFSFSHKAFASTIITTDITSNTLWDIAGSPYIVLMPITVAQGVSLVIDPGVTVQFDENNYAGIGVYGSLFASGTANNPINFTGLYNNGIHSWAGITFLNTVNTNTLSYINFENSNLPVAYLNSIGPNLSHIDLPLSEGIAANNSTISISDSTFHAWSEPVYAWNNSHVTASNLNLSANGNSCFFITQSSASISHVTCNNVTYGIYAADHSSVSAEDMHVNPNIAQPGFELLWGIVSTLSSSVIFNNSSVENIISSNSKAAYVFDDSSFSATNSLFSGGVSDGIFVAQHGTLSLIGNTIKNFLGTGVSENGDPQHFFAPDTVTMSGNTITNNGYGIQILSDNPVLSIANNSIYGNTSYGAMTSYSNQFFNLENNWWGDSSGPYNPASNPSGLGNAVSDGIDFTPWISSQLVSSTPANYYARIKNAPNGVMSLYEQANTASTLVKTLPNDWVVYVDAKTDAQGNSIFNNGYLWFRVIDKTDGSVMWMPAASQSGLTIYLPYDSGQQGSYQGVAVNSMDPDTNNPVIDQAHFNSRRQTFVDAVEHYFSNIDTIHSLYSSDDHSSLKLSDLVTYLFPKELIMAIGYIEESDFDNKIVWYDYGHGIMQVTTDAHKHEGIINGYLQNSNDPRGILSDVKLKKCKEIATNEYEKCHIHTGTKNGLLKKYDFYDHNPLNVKYKQYGNTKQSIYANVKDGLGIFRTKYGTVYNHPCSNSVIIGGLTYTCNDLKRVKAVWGYNGAIMNTSVQYMLWVSQSLAALSTHFPGYTYANQDQLIEKLAVADVYRQEIRVHSPVELRIRDSKGNITGLIDGKDFSNIENSYYDAQSERALILFPKDVYSYQVVGTGTGPYYGIDIDIFNGDKELFVSGEKIPIKKGEIHTYNLLKNPSSKNKVSVSIDTDGDGKPERTMDLGSKFSGDNFKENRK